jgi:DnaJ homolog subfamily C member 19
MLTKALLLLAIAFLALGALRFAMAPPRPRWLAPALAGATTAALLFRFGILGVLAGAAVAAALWFWPQQAKVEMAVADAQALLGLGPTATADDIRAAHRRRIADAHPDRGGNAELAARLNAARDLLLRKVRG